MKQSSIKHIKFALYFLFIFVITENSYAAIININSLTNNESNPVSMLLDAGTYSVSVIGINDGGAYNSWNAWNGGQVNGCDINGENCSVGWINNYYISSVEFGEMFMSDDVRYANSTLALANAISTSFTLSSSAIVDFYIRDGTNGNLAWDNVGGISLNVSIPNNVPVPAAWILMFTGLTVLFRFKYFSRN